MSIMPQLFSCCFFQHLKYSIYSIYCHTVKLTLEINTLEMQSEVSLKLENTPNILVLETLAINLHTEASCAYASQRHTLQLHDFLFPAALSGQDELYSLNEHNLKFCFTSLAQCMDSSLTFCILFSCWK